MCDPWVLLSVFGCPPNTLMLARAISRRATRAAMLARQLVEMSKRNWTKHRKVQASLLLGVGGVALIAMAAIA